MDAVDFSRKQELEALIETMSRLSNRDISVLEEVYRDEVGTNDYYKEKYRIIKAEYDSRKLYIGKNV